VSTKDFIEPPHPTDPGYEADCVNQKDLVDVCSNRQLPAFRFSSEKGRKIIFHFCFCAVL